MNWIRIQIAILLILVILLFVVLARMPVTSPNLSSFDLSFSAIKLSDVKPHSNPSKFTTMSNEASIIFPKKQLKAGKVHFLSSKIKFSKKSCKRRINELTPIIQVYLKLPNESWSEERSTITPIVLGKSRYFISLSYLTMPKKDSQVEFKISIQNKPGCQFWLKKFLLGTFE